MALVVLALAAVSVAGTKPASALALITTDNFSGSTDLIHLNSFDPSLGTLDTVSVSITGAIELSGATIPRIVGFGTPSPYPYEITVSQNFFPGAFGMGFGFGAPASMLVIGVATGSGGMIQAPVTFNYTFSFSEIFDLVGFTIPTMTIGGGGGLMLATPGIINGTRSDFIDPLAPIGVPVMETIMTNIVSNHEVAFSSVTALATGAVVVQYDYTQAAEVPEPGSLALFAVGLLGVGLFSRRRRRSAAA